MADDWQDDIIGGETRSVAELLEAWGVEGQPFDWSVDALRPTPGGAVADVSLAEPSTVGLLDAAVHVARLVGGTNPAAHGAGRRRKYAAVNGSQLFAGFR